MASHECAASQCAPDVDDCNKVTLVSQSQTNRLLGYPPDARLLIINADDFGMCHAINEAIIRALEKGVLRSTTLMVPCPWALHAMHFLADHPEVPFGVHLTVTLGLGRLPLGAGNSRRKGAITDRPGRPFLQF